MITVIILIDVL